MDFIDYHEASSPVEKPRVSLFVQVERAEPCEGAAAPGCPGEQQ